eukprot:1895703-Ditylum_brightwellii.AAC.1
MVQFSCLKFTIDKLVSEVDISLAVPIRNLDCRTKRNQMSRAMIPLLRDAFVTFCQEHDILLPFGNTDDDRSTKSDVSDLTNFSGLTLNTNKAKESNNNNKMESEQSDKNNERQAKQDQVNERPEKEIAIYSNTKQFQRKIKHLKALC